jgi:hypothetical protein
MCGDDLYTCADRNRVECSLGTDTLENMNFADDDCDGTSDDGFSVLALGYDDATGASGDCPPGYQRRGQTTGVAWDGHALRAGWLLLCSPTSDVLLAMGRDDYANVNRDCPAGYGWRGAFKVDTVPHDGGPSGIAFDGYELREGWLMLCSRSVRETLVIGENVVPGGPGDVCPGGTQERGSFKPDESTLTTAVATSGASFGTGTLRYCVAN